MAIVSYRLKRLESIIKKLDRYPKMKLSRMWDIGGCRCILKSEKQVYKLRDRIYQNLNVRKEYDYIKDPQPEGYQSLHLFIESNDGRVIEVQIRNQQQHNWATLVEISDLLFEAGLKEFKRDKDLLEFHKLLSEPTKLNLANKKRIAQILKKYDYYNKLNYVFLRNSPKVRSQWVNIKLKPNQRYFILKTSKEDVPQILSFEHLDQAEIKYFEMFLNNKFSNIVLTHLTKPNFNQISTAYSNYILTYHAFISEWLRIYEDLIYNTIEECNAREFKELYEEYINISTNQMKAMFEEVDFANEILKGTNTRDSKVKKMFKYWQSDLNKLANKKGKELNLFRDKIDKDIPYNNLSGKRMRSIKNKLNRSFNDETIKLYNKTL